MRHDELLGPCDTEGCDRDGSIRLDDGRVVCAPEALAARGGDPTPERVTLTSEERDELACVATGHEPDHCDCNDAYRDDGDRFCENAHETFTAVERILAAREKALREEIAGKVERKAQHLNAAEDYGRGGRDGLNAAARIARGGPR